jgi:FMN phosphatase YigB (HAD superfamily)
MRHRKVLITDIDNTLFDWFGMWHASFTSMMCEVLSITHVPAGQLVKEIKAVHQEFGTSEYAFLLESLPSLQKLYGDRESIRSAVTPAIDAYRAARAETLHLYPSVLDTLTELKNRGVVVVGFSESKLYYSSYRISKLGLDGVMDRLYCPEDHKLPEGNDHSRGLEKTKPVELDAQFKKPKAATLHEILSELGSSAEECLYVGDSKTKDVRMAIDAGIDCAWFSSGAAHIGSMKRAYNLLRRVTHWTPAEVEAERAMAENRTRLDESAYTTIHEYSEVLNFFPKNKN